MAGGLLGGFDNAAARSRSANLTRLTITLGIVLMVVAIYHVTGALGSPVANLSSFLLPVLIPQIPVHRPATFRMWKRSRAPKPQVVIGRVY
jgi:hypothetical protein